MVAASQALAQMNVLTTALSEAQAERDALKGKVSTLEEDLAAASARTVLFQKQEEALLLEASKSKETAALEKMRIDMLERQKEHLQKTISDIEVKEQEIAALLRETGDNESARDAITGSGDESEAAKLRINAVIDRTKETIKRLRSEKEQLESSKKEIEESNSRLQQAIRVNDYYTQILDMINDRSVSDARLALFIWSIKNIQDRDTDQLSEGKPQRLIEALLEVTHPFGDRPADFNPDYENCFRTLGNYFIPESEGKLVWKGGTPIDTEKCHDEDAEFWKKGAEWEQHAESDLAVSAR